MRERRTRRLTRRVFSCTEVRCLSADFPVVAYRVHATLQMKKAKNQYNPANVVFPRVNRLAPLRQLRRAVSLTPFILLCDTPDVCSVLPCNQGDNAAPELCAPGFRNPWKCSFDRETDELYCGCVRVIWKLIVVLLLRLMAARCWAQLVFFLFFF